MFSGKENPEWAASDELTKKILTYCNDAGPWEQDFEIPAILGYNGIEFFNKEKNQFLLALMRRLREISANVWM